MGIEDLKIGKKVLKVNQEKLGRCLNDLIEFQIIFGKHMKLESMDVLEPHTLTERDMQFYTLNPRQIKYDLKEL